MTAERKRFLCALLVASAPFLFFWSTGLFDFDEGVYSAVVGEMSRTGNWLIPMLNGEPWFEKPILLYWLAGPSIAAFGQQIGPRLPSVLCSIGTIALCGWFVGRRSDGPRARLAMWILGGSLLFTTVGNLMLTDAMMLFGLTAAILLWIESVVGDGKWRYLSAFALGWALLAKGPVVVALMLVIVVWSGFAEPELRANVCKGWIAYILVVLAVGCTWYVPAYLARPTEFVDIFVLQQNVGRLLGGDEAHRVPWYLYLPYYVIVLGVAFAPWFYLAKRCLPSKGSSAVPADFSVRVAARWAILVFLLFTLSGSKLPHYILPVVPAIAVMLGIRLGSESEFVRMKYERLSFAMVVLCTAVNLYLFPKYYSLSGERQAHQMVDYVKSTSTPLVTYLIRSPISDASIKSQVQDTTLPSLSFYLDASVPDYFALGQLEKLGRTTFVLTRNGKLESGDLERLGRKFSVERIKDLSDEHEFQLNNGRFELFKLTLD